MHLGIDLGGTKIEVVVLDSQNNSIERMRMATPTADYQQILSSINTLTQEIESKGYVISSIGVGTPGSLDTHTGTIKNANTQCLNGKPLKEDLIRLLGRNIVVANDADCFALSEATDGAGKDLQCLFGVIIGTGTGGGIIMNKQLHTGSNQIAGEWGHNPMPYASEKDFDNRSCYCGKSACIETFLSGPGLSLTHYFKSGIHLTPPEIEQAANDGDRHAKQSLLDYASQLARSTATVINLLDPDIIVLGGGLSNFDYLYQIVPRLWRNFVFSSNINTVLAPAHFGDSSGVRGAAWLGKRAN